MKSALLIVDVQNDFCPGGSLGVAGGDQVLPILNEYAERFARADRLVLATRDWHPLKTKHFAIHGGMWPVHCVQGTPGAAFHPDLRLPPGTAILSKGADPEEDAYSAFHARGEEGTLLDILRHHGIEHLYIGGLATDYCVRYSVIDARNAGLAVTVLLDGCRGVNVQPGDVERALVDMLNAGGDFTTLQLLDLGAE